MLRHSESLQASREEELCRPATEGSPREMRRGLERAGEGRLPVCISALGVATGHGVFNACAGLVGSSVERSITPGWVLSSEQNCCRRNGALGRTTIWDGRPPPRRHAHLSCRAPEKLL